MAILSLTDQQLLTINEKTKALQDAVTTYFSSPRRAQ